PKFSLPYKTVRYVLSSLWLSTNCRMPDSASRFYADPYKPVNINDPQKRALEKSQKTLRS
ncbi:MAG TPA: hypothetical protein VEP90_09145, partial [Methylomirabilota bacterium]|nr:hypothetical protein [Methylomirabilota bacterium]